MTDEVTIKLSRDMAEALAAQLGIVGGGGAATLTDPPGESVYGIKLLTKDLKSAWAGRDGLGGTVVQYGRNWQYVGGHGCYIDTGAGPTLVAAGDGTEDLMLVLMECSWPNPYEPGAYFYVRIVAVQGLDWEQKHTDMIPRAVRDRVREGHNLFGQLTPEQYRLIVDGPGPAKTRTTVAYPQSIVRAKMVCSAHNIFCARCRLYYCAVCVDYTAFPEIWRGQRLIMSDAPLIARSLVRPALEARVLYLPGTNKQHDSTPALWVFDTRAEACAFYHEKLIPTLEALAQLADDTLIVDEEAGEQDR